VPVRDIAVGPVQRNGAQREGALPATTKALQGSVPELAYGRPYAVDLTGWFDDFSNSGIYDAVGGESRAGTHVNAFASVNGSLTFIPPEAIGLHRGAAAAGVATAQRVAATRAKASRPWLTFIPPSCGHAGPRAMGDGSLLFRRGGSHLSPAARSSARVAIPSFR